MLPIREAPEYPQREKRKGLWSASCLPRPPSGEYLGCVSVMIETGMARAHITKMNRPEDAPEAFQSAWNAHDMATFGALFHEDATFVNRFAHYVRGVEQIIDLHRSIHETIYRDSTLRNELIDAVPIGDEVAIIHFWSRLSVGAAHPAGAHEVDTLIQAVLTRRDGSWRIKAVENVTLADPRTGAPVLRR